MVLAALVIVPARARADEGRLLGDDTFALQSHGQLVLDGGLLVAMPAALPAGMSTGLGAGITRECSCWWAYGARLSWSQISESSVPWTATHMDFRLRATAAVRHRFGRGSLALRLGAGTTVVYEHRTRNGSTRLPPMSGFSSRAVAALPAADLEGVVALHVTGPWLFVVSAGPSVDYFDSKLRGGFTAMLGIGWQP